MTDSLKSKIRILKTKLIDAVETHHGQLCHPRIIRISQELDELIVQYQQNADANT